MDENNKHNIVRVHDVAKLIVQAEAPPPPPPPDFISSFETLQEWLFNVCDNDHPEESITEYQFSLVETSNNDMLFLSGFNAYNIAQNTVAIRTDFKPTNAFFPLPKSEYGNLSKEQLLKRLLNELKEFTKATKFQNSFLSKGETISTNFSGKFWPI